MKVALLTDGVSPIVTGGMQKHSFYLAKYLAINKINVDIYHCTLGKKEPQLKSLFTEEEWAYIEEIKVGFPTKGFLPFQYIRNSYAYSLSLLEAFKQREPVDFIYAQGFTAYAFFKEKKKGNIQAPIGVNFHGLEMFQLAEGWKSKLTQYLFKGPVKYNIQHADYVYSLGGKLTGILNQFCKKEQVVEIPIGLDPEWVRKDSVQPRNTAGVTRFVFIGRYERRKGIEELNQVLSTLDDPNIQVDFIGPIPPSKKIKSARYVYHGLIKGEKAIQEILDQADVLLCPSLAEGMPTVILEAMARGLAVIATDVGAVAVEVDDSNGWLIEAGNTVPLNQAIAEAITLDDESLMTKKQNSLKRIQEMFLWPRTIEKTLAHIEEALAVAV